MPFDFFVRKRAVVLAKFVTDIPLGQLTAKDVCFTECKKICLLNYFIIIAIPYFLLYKCANIFRWYLLFLQLVFLLEGLRALLDIHSRLTVTDLVSALWTSKNIDSFCYCWEHSLNHALFLKNSFDEISVCNFVNEVRFCMNIYFVLMIFFRSSQSFLIASGLFFLQQVAWNITPCLFLLLFNRTHFSRHYRCHQKSPCVSFGSPLASGT